LVFRAGNLSEKIKNSGLPMQLRFGPELTAEGSIADCRFSTATSNLKSKIENVAPMRGCSLAEFEGQIGFPAGHKPRYEHPDYADDGQRDRPGEELV
jgi:hypothetical protein